jgi:hypothetical protein
MGYGGNNINVFRGKVVMAKFNFSFLLMMFLFPGIGKAETLLSASDIPMECTSSHGDRYNVDVSLFPKTIRVNGVYLEFQSFSEVNDGFKEGHYRQAYGSAKAGLAVREGYKPVLIEHDITYVCDQAV